MTVNILGTPYEIIIKKYDEEEAFERRSIAGFCDLEHENEQTCAICQKENLRHEIVHAFFNESGLCECSNEYGGAWSKNEELIDWIALQGVKIYNAWAEVGAI